MGVLTIPRTYADGQILGAANLDNAFDTVEAFINSGQISGENIQDNSISASEIQTSSVTAAKIANNAVTTAKIADLSITASKLAAALAAFLVPTGRITAYAGDTAPTGWAICDGSAISRTTYSDLFALTGVRFGQGDGTTTFNIPDFRGRFLRGVNGTATGASVTGSGSASSNLATFSAHLLNTGDPVRLQSGALTGLSLATTYFVYRSGPNTIGFALNYANAMAGTLIAISGTNSAVIARWRDPQVEERTAMGTGGAVGNNVGSVQLDDWKIKEAIISTVSGTSGISPFGGGDPATPRAALSIYTTDTTKSGIETRPVNAAVNFMIKL